MAKNDMHCVLCVFELYEKTNDAWTIFCIVDKRKIRDAFTRG